MNRDRAFNIFLIISLAAHAVLLASIPILNPSLNKKTLQNIEITYRKVASENKEKIIASAERITPQVKKVDPFSLAKKPPPAYAELVNIPKFEEGLIIKPPVYKKDNWLSVRPKKIMLSEPISLKEKLPKNPIYLTYYRVIREKIRRYAYYNYNRDYAGDVYISFAILKDGNLKWLEVVDEKSSPDSYLKEIAARSIKDASPFAPIPQELDYAELSFSIIIAFELD